MKQMQRFFHKISFIKMIRLAHYENKVNFDFFDVFAVFHTLCAFKRQTTHIGSQLSAFLLNIIYFMKRVK